MKSYQLRVSMSVVVVLGATAPIAGWVLFGGKVGQPGIAAASRSALRRPSGSAQVVSVETLPAIDGLECEWAPASASTRLIAALEQNGPAPAADSMPSGETRTSSSVERPPLRIIGDLYDVMTSVAVDPARNEIVVQGTKLMVYDRMANTPPTADVAPIRVLRGPDTQIETARSLAVDPVHDLLIVGCDNADHWRRDEDVRDATGYLVIFNRTDNGNAKPRAVIKGPKTGLGNRTLCGGGRRGHRSNQSEGSVVGHGDASGPGSRYRNCGWMLEHAVGPANAFGQARVRGSHQQPGHFLCGASV
jgi:hypothetical protein